MTDQEAMKLALDALKGLKSLNRGCGGLGLSEINRVHRNNDTAIKALEEALAKQEQGEPVAMYREKCADGSRCLHGCHTNEPCHSTPQQYKPLTGYERASLVNKRTRWNDAAEGWRIDAFGLIDDVEAKIKELDK